MARSIARKYVEMDLFGSHRRKIFGVREQGGVINGRSTDHQQCDDQRASKEIVGWFPSCSFWKLP
jgi:hypothetical protein